MKANDSLFVIIQEISRKSEKRLIIYYIVHISPGFLQVYPNVRRVLQFFAVIIYIISKKYLDKICCLGALSRKRCRQSKDEATSACLISHQLSFKIQ